MIRRLSVAFFVLMLFPFTLQAQTTSVVVVDEVHMPTVKMIGEARGELARLIDAEGRYKALQRDEVGGIENYVKKNVTFVLKVTYHKKGDFELVWEKVGLEPQVYTSKLGRGAGLKRLGFEVEKALVGFGAYTVPKRMYVLKIQAKAEGEPGDGGLAEGAVEDYLSSQWRRIPTDDYNWPIGKKHWKALTKGNKKALSVLKEASKADVLILGDVTIPKLKNIGGAQDNLYRGTAKVDVRAYDMASGELLGQALVNLKGQGQYSEMVFTLMANAGEYIGKEMAASMGVPEKKAQENPAEGDFPSDGRNPKEDY